MNDPNLDDRLREHYRAQGLDPVRVDQMVRQARQRKAGVSAERILLWVTVAAVLLFVIQSALVPARFAPHESLGSAVPVQQEIPVNEGPVANLRVTSREAGTVNCGGSVTPFDRRLDLSFEAETLPISCLVTIDGRSGVFHVSGDRALQCDVDGSRVTCQEPEPAVRAGEE